MHVLFPNIFKTKQYVEGQVLDHLYEQYYNHIEQSELISLHLLGVNLISLY